MGLSSEDVKLRLPSDGAYWATERPAQTPFFNVWDTSKAKIDKSVSFLPSHLSSLADKDKEVETTAPTPERVTQVPNVDTSTIGAFAYCVESTEYLNRIVKFFLQRPVDFRNEQEFSAWLTRFKELDLQLIQYDATYQSLSWHYC